MVRHGSRDETSDLVSSFNKGYLKQISHQLTIMRAEVRSGQDRIEAKTDRHLVFTGQILEAVRKMEPPAAPPSGPAILHQIKEVLSFLGALYKAWPVIRWAMYANAFGWAAKHVARFFGWL